MKTNTKAKLFDLTWKSGVAVGLSLATLHLSLAPLAERVVRLDRALFPTVQAQGAPLSAVLFPWTLPKRTVKLPKPVPKPTGKGCTRDYKAIHALDCSELVALLKQAGFEGPALRTAYAVARAESSGRPKAFNGNTRTGDQSYGVFQVNMLNRLGPARRKQFGLKSNDELYDPLVNAKAAFQISSGGKNWRPWGAHSNGSYRKFLSEFDTL